MKLSISSKSNLSVVYIRGSTFPFLKKPFKSLTQLIFYSIDILLLPQAAIVSNKNPIAVYLFSSVNHILNYRYEVSIWLVNRHSISILSPLLLVGVWYWHIKQFTFLKTRINVNRRDWNSKELIYFVLMKHIRILVCQNKIFLAF